MLNLNWATTRLISFFMGALAFRTRQSNIGEAIEGDSFAKQVSII